MAVGSRLHGVEVVASASAGRDRCSMAVGSRLDAVDAVLYVALDVAIDARWLWDRDRRAVTVTPIIWLVAIDARWLWDRDKE